MTTDANRCQRSPPHDEARDPHPRRARGRLDARQASLGDVDASPLGHRRGAGGLRSRGTPGGAAQRVRARSSSPRTAIRSRSSSPRRRTGCRTCCRCATAGWPPRRSRSTAARRRSWRFDLSTTPRSDIIVQASGDAHLSNFGLFASPGADARLRLERLRRDAARAVGVGRQAPRRERRDRRRAATASRAAETRDGRPGDRARLPRADGDATPGCGCSTSGTTRRPPTTSRAAR